MAAEREIGSAQCRKFVEKTKVEIAQRFSGR